MKILRKIRILWADRQASSLVEFALFAPLVLLLLAASVDLGQAILTRFKLGASLAVASNYALANASSASSSGGAALAATLAALAASEQAAHWANVSVVVNNGPSVSVTGASSSAAGVAANADSCYCPTGSGAALAWGAAQSCGASCASGALAGKFIQIVATKNFSALLLPSSLIPSSLTRASVVQLQ